MDDMIKKPSFSAIMSVLFFFIFGVGLGAYLDSKTFDTYRILVDSKPSPYVWDDSHVYGGKMLVTPLLDHDTGKEYLVITTSMGVAVIPKN